MSKSRRNLSDPCNKLMDALRTNFEDALDAARVYDKIIVSAPAKKQQGLFFLIVTRHRLLREKKSKRVKQSQFSHATAAQDASLLSKYGALVAKWWKSISLHNPTQGKAAEHLYNNLMQIEVPYERVVALSLLLYHLPYAPFNPQSLSLAPPEKRSYNQMREHILPALALHYRLNIQEADFMNPLDIANETLAILEGISDRLERAVLLREILRSKFRLE